MQQTVIYLRSPVSPPRAVWTVAQWDAFRLPNKINNEGKRGGVVVLNWGIAVEKKARRVQEDNKNTHTHMGGTVPSVFCS